MRKRVRAGSVGIRCGRSAQSGDPMSDGDFDSRLAPELRGGDDPALWHDALRRVAEDVAGLDRDLETPPRHVLLSVVRIRSGRPGAHPDDKPTLRLSWERDRGDADWR